MFDTEPSVTIQAEIAVLLNEPPETLHASLAELSSSIANQEVRIQMEVERQKKWRAENERRRHNYVPFIFEMLQQLAQKGMLEGLFKDAVEAKKKKQEEKKAAAAKK